MTTPAQDRDQRAALSAPREVGDAANLFDMDRIEELRAELARFDAMDLSRVRVKRGGRIVERVPQGILADFSFTGLRNIDLAVFWPLEDR